MKKLLRLYRGYRQLSLVLLAVLIGLALEISGLHSAARWLLSLTALASAVPLLWGMLQDVRDGQYGIDILAATAIIASVLLGEYWTAMVVVVMLTGGESLEAYAERRAKSELTSLLSRAPKKAHLRKGQKVIDILASAVKANDTLIIKPGELVPVDAMIIEGQSSLDESSLTGESLPVEKQVGDELLSGSVNLDGLIVVKALRKAADSQYQQIIKLVRSASANQSPFVRLADRYSIPFTIIAYVIAGSVWAISGDPIRFLMVIVVATPCPLLLAAPIALISGMSRAAKHGIIVKTGSALEKLAAVKTIGFDKTGTLTVGQPSVDKVEAAPGFNKAQILLAAGSLEQHSNHSLAQAVVGEAHKHHAKLIKVKGVREEAGFGLSGLVKGQKVLVGKASLLTKAKVAIPPRLAKVAATTAFVAIEGQFAGIISFSDALRPETKSTLTRLRHAGIKHILMITGDNQATAQMVAKQIGVTDISADCLPANKLRVLETIPNRPVAFVGDGVNDAPVLAAADVGIALGARGSAAASESADVVIMLDDLNRVASAVVISKRTFFIARQSILIGIFISVGLMLIFATGRFEPIWGAALQEVVDVAVIFNALRAHGPWRSADLIS